MSKKGFGKFLGGLALGAGIGILLAPDKGENTRKVLKKKIEELNGNVELRTASNKDGFLMSDEGNILLDVYFDGVKDIRLLNQTLLMMPGVVDTSLFVDILTGMILVNDKGVFKKERNGEFYAL